MFGESQLNTDKFLRTLGWARIAQKEVEQLDAEMTASLQAYASGVNAYLASHRGSAISLEYAVLKLLNPSYQPETWQPLHTLTWGKAMAWDLGYNMSAEIQRSILLKTLTPAQVDELFPPYDSEQPVIVPKYTRKAEDSSVVGTRFIASVSGDEGKKIGDAGAVESEMNPALAADIAPALQLAAANFTGLDALLGPRGSGIGSNSWVISGQRTGSGKPILANDPHLGVQMPSIWYEIGLHCTPKAADCPYDVTGFSFAGMLGVIVGHNDRIAWGVTNVGPDVMDLYVEKINPKNPNQYEVRGKWQDMQLVEETIQVAGGKSVSQTVRYTRHGPVISDTYKRLKDFDEQKGIKVPNNYAIALRWTALEPSNIIYAIPQINRATNWQDFRAGVKKFDVPAQNFVYADEEGNIGYQMPGKIPIRAGGDGRYPAAGWTDDFEWKGYIPFEKLPSAFNPPQGYIATANNRVVGREYPYFITTEWDYGYRAQRIVGMIEGHKTPIDLADVQKMQGDSKSLNAEMLVPALLGVPLNSDRLESARSLLRDWDFQENMDGAAPAVFEAFWKHLLADTFQDELPKQYWPDGDDRWVQVVRNLVRQPKSFWWDNKTTRAVESRDDIFRKAFAEGVAELERTLGKDASRWRWGDLHTVTFRNLTLGKSGVGAIEFLLNRGAFRTAGGSSIVNATQWNAAESFAVTWLPSMRMVVDLAKPENSLSINSTGQSGHAFHGHYDDMIELWRKIDYHPMLWEREAVAAGGKRLTLKP